MMTGQKVSRRQFLQSALLGVGSLLLAQSPLKIFAVVKPERQEGQNEPNISSQEADTLYRRAKTLFYDRRYAEATAIYQQLIAAFPTCVRYYDGLARVLGGQQLLFEKTAAYLNDELQYEMTYHPNGNIHTKTDVGEYAYYLPQPHAMSGIVGEASAAVTNEIQEISYTAFNKVCSIDQDNDRYLIYYGLDEQRIKTEYYYADSLRHTRYYLGAYELDIDSAGNETPVNYVYAPSGLIAIVQSNEIYYVHTDHLGSLQALTGNIVSEYAYTPWGGRILLTGANLTDRGYTGHEHLPVLGLINMNGRIYDPTFARFLSPDPFVQAPNFSQSFNRYSYCLNNPLRYTDPDGENPIIAAIIIGAAAGAGGYTGYKIADAKGYDFSNWQTYGYILGGAVIGGASGYLGATIAAGGGFMANTMGIMYSSAFNSMGMTALSGGMMSPSISFGVASYDFGTGEWGYLGKKGNKWYQNLGYGLGALANLKDINDIINSTAARVYTQKQYPQDDGGGKDYKISHTSVVKEGTGTFSYKGDNLFNKDGILMSYGPNSGAKLPGFIGFAVEPKLSTPLYATYPDLSLKSDILSLNKYLFSGLRAVSKYSLYQGFSSNCVNWASLGLWLNGIPNIGIHPFLLHGSLTVYNTGIYNMLSYQLLYK